MYLVIVMFVFAHNVVFSHCVILISAIEYKQYSLGTVSKLIQKHAYAYGLN